MSQPSAETSQANVEKIRALRPVDIYKDHISRWTEWEFQKACKDAIIWHSVDLGDLFIEGQKKNSTITLMEMQRADLPDFRGKTVLDIGAFTGWFSFEAERRGAAHVTALEYHSWVVDHQTVRKHMRAEQEAGRIGSPYHLPPEIVDAETQPGRAVFDATKLALGSKVEPVLCLAEDYNPGKQFDIVLYLGVLYHCENPMASLKKVASLTKECLVIETLGAHFPGLENRAVWDFFGDDSVNNDITTWWAPNEKGLVDMLKSFGFSRVEIKSGADTLPDEKRTRTQPIRIWVHAYR